VTHPGTGSYGYAWTPAGTLAPGSYLATWSGLKSGSPVTATETVTVYAPASAAATNTSPRRHLVRDPRGRQGALDVRETARSNAAIDRASKTLPQRAGLTHRRFYPTLRRPAVRLAAALRMTPWILRLDDQELISVSADRLGRRDHHDSGDYLLEPAELAGPPSTASRSTSARNASFGGGSTYQRDIQIAGLWGYRNTETTVGATVEALDDTRPASTSTPPPRPPSASAPSCGSTPNGSSSPSRTQLSTGQTLGRSASPQERRHLPVATAPRSPSTRCS
jgi:hypothetical protein